MIASILENVAYIGMTESFKSTRLGFKSRKRIPTAKDRRTYIEDAHTPIINRDMWEKVQMIRENKRRPTKSGMTSIFSGLLYCADCGAKLSLATANGYEHFRCSMYKRTSRAKECTQHYIREDTLKQLVLKQLQQFLSYADHAVQPTILADCGIHQRLNLLGTAAVSADKNSLPAICPNLINHSLSLLLAAGCTDHLHPGFPKYCCNRPANPTARAGNNCNLSLYAAKIHHSYPPNLMYR